MSQKNRHHRKARSNGGKSNQGNVVRVNKDLHDSFHHLFGNATVHEIAKILNDTWINPDYKLIVKHN